MGVEPGQAVGCHTAERGENDLFVRIDDRKLLQERLRLVDRVGPTEQGLAPMERPRDGGEKFDHCLMRNEQPAGGKPLPEHLHGSRPFLRKSPIDAIHENVGINQNGHDRRDPRESSRGRPLGAAASRPDPGAPAAPWPRQKPPAGGV